MNDLIVQVSKGYRTVIPAKTFIGNDGENLQTKLIFTFLDEFIDGVGRLEVLIDNEKSYIPLIKDKKTYYLPIKNVMTKVGNIELQLVITEPENENGIPLYKSDIFKLYCKNSINAVEEAPEGYDLWIDIANAKIIEIDEKIVEVNKAIVKTNNLNISVSKTNGTTSITLTKKDGTKDIVKVYDGATGNGIESITKTSSSGLVDTYTILYTDGTSTTFDVTNGEDGTDGRGIASITKTSTSGYVDTYTITYTDGTTSTFEVTNGEVSQAELDETNAEVERAMMVYNVLPKVEDTGTEITLNDTINCPMKLELSPSELTQETTTGKQLFDKSIEKSLIYVTPDVQRTGYQIPLPAGTYTVSGGNNNINVKTLVNSIYGDYFNLTNPVTLTLNDNGYILIYALQGIMFTNEILNSLLLQTGSSATSYEPYTGGIPQPNPDYPSEVQVIKGNNSIKIENKNLFNENDVELNKTLNSSTGAVTTSDTWYVTNPIKVEGLTTLYKSSYNRTKGALNCFYDINNTFISSVTQLNGVINVPNNAYYMRTEGLKTELSMPLLIERGSTATDYVAHQEQVLPLNLPSGMEYCKIGSYEDEFEHNGDKWYLNKYIGKVVLDGTESNWSYSSSNTNFNIRPVYLGMRSTAEAKGYIPKICNYFKYYASNGNIANLADGIYENTNQSQYTFLLFHCDSLNITTLEAWYTWLGINKPTIYYQLETPTHEEITDTTLISQLNAIEQAVSYDEQTNISQTNTQLSFRIKASAIRSLVNIFDGGA